MASLNYFGSYSTLSSTFWRCESLSQKFLSCRGQNVRSLGGLHFQGDVSLASRANIVTGWGACVPVSAARSHLWRLTNHSWGERFVACSDGLRLLDSKKRTDAKLPRHHVSVCCHRRNENAHGGARACKGELVSYWELENRKEQCSSLLDSPGIQRRQLILGGLAAASLLPSSAHQARALATDTLDSPSAASSSTASSSTAIQVDPINAYSYVYPVGLQSSLIRWVESRKPERYSSAAPLSPDARQRIVSERLNLANTLVVSVSVGPPNFSFLKPGETSTWKAKDVANSVLTDKSTARMTSGQRVAEISILDFKSEEKDGVQYWYYEYTIQKSPSTSERSLDVFRHSVAVTAEREGYLYTLNVSTLSSNWNRLKQTLNKSVQSFRLDQPTAEYIPPYKDPWRFW